MICEIHEFIGEDLPVKVKFEFYPAEKQVINPIEQAYPGHPATLDVIEVILYGKEITESISEEEMERITQSCWDSLPEQEADNHFTEDR